MIRGNEQKMIILRYSEVGLKGSRARSMMVSLLKSNVNQGLNRVNEKARITTERGRIYIDGYSSQEKVLDVLSRTMGVKSYSPVILLTYKTLEDIVNKAVELYSQRVGGKKFAVRSRRAGGQKFTSKDLNLAVGDALYDYSAGVDLTNPEIEVDIEVRNNRAYYFTETYAGPGGLPLGSESPLVALVSGGIDSPVAAWMLMKRGSPVDFVFLTLSHPIDTVEFLTGVKALVDKWCLGYDPVIHIVDGKPLIDLLVVSQEFKVPGVTYKRILYQIAINIAHDRKAFGIITGESLGQVSSQTPENLLAINHTIDFPVYRPLIGMDKDEITEIARRIGTFPVTSKGEFCSLFSQNVVLNASPEVIDNDYRRFSMLDDLVKNRTVLKGSDLDNYLGSISDEDYEVNELPKDSIVVDLRSGQKYNEWHYDGAFRSNLGGIKNIVEENGKDKVYVFYCQKGLQSAYAASAVRNLGARSYYTTTDKMRRMK